MRNASGHQVKMSDNEKKWRTRNLASAPDIERAHRVGKSSRKPASAQNSASRPRTIVCRLRDWKEGETILKCARRIKPDNIFVKEDLSPATLEKRESQRAKMEAAKRAGKIAYFVLDKLVIRDRPVMSRTAKLFISYCYFPPCFSHLFFFFFLNFVFPHIENVLSFRNFQFPLTTLMTPTST